MVYDEDQNQQSDVAEARMFFVRLGENDEAPFAVCERIGTADGMNVLPGSGKTVAELVAEQALLAAAIPPGDENAFSDVAQVAVGVNESGRND